MGGSFAHNVNKSKSYFNEIELEFTETLGSKIGSQLNGQQPTNLAWSDQKHINTLKAKPLRSPSYVEGKSALSPKQWTVSQVDEEDNKTHKFYLELHPYSLDLVRSNITFSQT